MALNDIHLENELKHCNIDKDNPLERSTIINEDKIKIANRSAKSQLKAINSLNNINAFKNEKNYTNKYQTINQENLMIKNTIESINHLYQNNLKTNCLLDNNNSNTSTINDKSSYYSTTNKKIKQKKKKFKKKNPGESRRTSIFDINASIEKKK